MTRTGIRAAVLLASGLVVTSAWAGDKTGSRRAPGETGPPSAVQAFQFSGAFTGVLDGSIRLESGDASFLITPDTQIYELGNGPVDPGAQVSKQLVYLTGVVIGGVNRVDAVIVRPAGELDNAPAEDAANIHEKDRSAPR